jgi:hypothetical protein
LKLDARRVLTYHIVFWDYVHSETETDVLNIWNIWHTLLITTDYNAFFMLNNLEKLQISNRCVIVGIDASYLGKQVSS